MSEMCEKADQARMNTVQEMLTERSSRLLVQQMFAELHAEGRLLGSSPNGGVMNPSARVRNVLLSDLIVEQAGVPGLEKDLVAASTSQAEALARLEALRSMLAGAGECSPEKYGMAPN
jgi:hypothetical protein